ncbi:hypothetical protein Cri9333_4778 (plasmid) [Crinalium epipsammum PCC 9333]|uniref:Uncharacterized protein n=1 Tax=Crinalium epipsammum PCC 9333 TaxID=1173022 RepID=K9W5V0_9CYAN|nr:hypothetical protein Cri9333_4778 [Crinalium epipsammum PCC 9333]
MKGQLPAAQAWPPPAGNCLPPSQKGDTLIMPNSDIVIATPQKLRGVQ